MVSIELRQHSEGIRQTGGQPARCDSGCARVPRCPRNSHTVTKGGRPPIAGFRHLCRLPNEPSRKRSEGETSTDRRSKVVGVVVRDTGAMRNSDVQAAAHVGIRNSGETVETLGEVMV